MHERFSRILGGPITPVGAVRMSLYLFPHAGSSRQQLIVEASQCFPVLWLGQFLSAGARSWLHGRAAWTAVSWARYHSLGFRPSGPCLGHPCTRLSHP